MANFQATLKSSCTFEGVGIHSGEAVTLTAKPAPSGYGIVFERLDVNCKIKASPENIGLANRATVLTDGQYFIKTPEHFLAACAGLGIDNCHVTITKEEIPICDGSSIDFVKHFLEVGIEYFDSLRPEFKIEEPIILTNTSSAGTANNTAKLIALPSQEPQLTMVLEYPDHFLGSQLISFDWNQDYFISDIAPARTYGFEHEVEALKNSGLAKGGSLENALVIGQDDFLNKPRFSDECVRHKCLDLIGDLSLFNHDIIGHIIGIGSGHALNNDLVKHLETLVRRV